MKKIEYLIVIMLSLVILSFFYNKGVNFADEGYMLHSAQRLYAGELPYKDFNFIYTPATLYIIAAGYFLFGESILTGRIIVLLIAVITSLVLYLVTRKLTKNKFVSLLCVLTYLSWAPTHISFPLPVMFCLLTGLLSLLIFIKIIDFKKTRYYFLLGVMVAITFFIKQNFGIALFFTFTLSFLFFKDLRQRKALWYFAGSFLGLLCFSLYLLLTDSFFGFISYSYYALGEYFSRHSIKAPSLFIASSPITSIIKLGIYLSPLLVSLVAILLSLKSKIKEKSVAICLFVIGYYLVGIYPSTDYVHISPLLSLLGLPLVVLFVVIKSNNILVILGLIIIITSGFYTALFKGFYRWSAPIIDQKYYSNHPRIKIWLNSSDFEKLTIYIQENSSKNDYIYYYLFEPMFYFITDRRNPIKNLDSFIPSKYQNEEYAKAIESKNTKLIITNMPTSTWSKSLLPNYILENYKTSATIGAYTVWKHK